ncbi:MAG: protein kinase domain-containing protein, partial [Planctomycetia bacterium]
MLIDKNGNAKIADFGIALSPNKTGEFAPSMGTLPYMSPEHLDGKPLDARSDLYSIGVLYHELLQGEIPYPPGGLNTLRSNISLGNVEFHPTHNNLSRGIRDILCRCLAKDPLNRFESVDSFAKALRSMPTRRHSSVLVVIVIILMIIMGVFAAYWWFSTRNSQYLGQTVSLNALEESLSHGR